MPVFQAGKNQAPRWCELESFEFIECSNRQSNSVVRESSKEEMIVCRGVVVASFQDVAITLREGSIFDLNGSGVSKYSILSYGNSLVCRLLGRWPSVTSSGVFEARTDKPITVDTPHTYTKTTGFDNHYHDCDEYWIVFEGDATVASEGKFYDVKPGDCVATGMGWHHDVVRVKGDKPLRAIFFEGTLEGAKRSGHLWEPKHGKAVPKTERV